MEQDPTVRLVGREVELATLGRLLAGLREGAGGQLVLVSGEPGIGKSSLLAAVGRQAEQSGCRLLRGGCWEGEAPSYWPWRQVLRALGDLDEPGEGLEDGPARRLVGGVDGPAPPGETEFDLFDQVGRTLLAAARRVPLVLLLDDLQWADAGSLRLLGFLRTVAAGEPLLVVGAYRDDEVGPGLEDLTAGATSLALAGLDHDAVLAVMTEVAGPRPPAELAARVADRCGGNPFFVRETTRLAFTSGGGWVDAVEPGAVPTGVRAIVRRRLDQVSDPCRRLLAQVAVAGDGADEALIAAAAGGLDVTDLVDEAEQARILARRRGGGVGFAHDLFRDVVLADLSPAAVADLNGRTATALAALEAGPKTQGTPSPGATGRIAAHFAAAGDAFLPDAVRWSVAAARAASSPEEACRHYERAVRLRSRVGHDVPTELPDMLELELGAATARARAGDAAQARGELAAIGSAARIAGRADLLAEAALATHALGARTSTQVLGGLALLEDALALTPSDDPTRGSRLRAARARTLSRIPGRHAEAWSSAQEAAELAHMAGDGAAEFEALLAQHDLLWTTDGRVTAEHLDQRLTLCEQLVRMAGADPLSERPALAHQLRAAALIEAGDPEGLTALVRHCELAEALGTARGRWWSLSRRAVLAALDGRADEAAQLSTQARQLGTMMGEPDADGCDQSLRCSLALLGLHVWEDWGGPAPDDPLWKVRHVLAGARALACGDRAAARAAVAAGLPPESSFTSVDLLAITAVLWAACGPDPERERMLAMLEPWAGRHLVVGGCAAYYGPVDRLRGDLAVALGRRGDASAWYDAATDAARRLGALAWAPPEPATDRERVVLEQEGATWRLVYHGRAAHLPDAKGLHDLATLVANPGSDVHVLTLLGRPAPAAGADLVLDAQARSAYRARLAVIDRELDQADHAGDAAAGEALAAERSALIAQLAEATGLGGRQRRLGDETEGARKTVGARIRDTLRRIDRVHPELGHYLREAVTIGTVCRYSPVDR